MQYSAVVAEDEATLRQELVEQLARAWPELRVVAEAEEGLAALRHVVLHQPDVVFLDIQMPGLNGLELARQIALMRQDCQIVFVTAYDEHAIQAFEAGAQDYLLKPLSLPRLLTTVTRLRQRLALPVRPVWHPTPSQAGDGSSGGAASAIARSAPLRWINASVGQSVRLLTVDEVLYFQADTKYTRVALQGRRGPDPQAVEGTGGRVGPAAVLADPSRDGRQPQCRGQRQS